MLMEIIVITTLLRYQVRLYHSYPRDWYSFFMILWSYRHYVRNTLINWRYCTPYPICVLFYNDRVMNSFYTGTQQRYRTNVPWRQNPRFQIYVYFWWKRCTTNKVIPQQYRVAESSPVHHKKPMCYVGKAIYKTHGLHRRSTRDTINPGIRFTKHRSSVHTHYNVHGIRFTIWTEIKTGRVNQEQTQHSTK